MPFFLCVKQDLSLMDFLKGFWLPEEAYSANSHRIIELFMLEKTFKIMESNHKPTTAKFTTKPCP